MPEDIATDFMISVFQARLTSCFPEGVWLSLCTAAFGMAITAP